MSGLTARQVAILRFIDSTMKATAVCPTFSEIAVAMGMSSRGKVHHDIAALVHAGYLANEPYQQRALRVLKLPEVHDPAALRDALALHLEGIGVECGSSDTVAEAAIAFLRGKV